MTRCRLRKLSLLACVALTLLCISVAEARRPTEPPGSGQNGGGVIYFSYLGELFTMNDDGSGIEQVAGFPEGFPIWGEPSRQTHNSKRWFAQSQGDQFVALSDAGDIVPLSFPPDLNYLRQPQWGVGDGFVSWIGQQVDIDPSSQTFGEVLQGGVYATELVFNQQDDITGSGVTALLVPIPLNGQSPDILSHDWSPDGTQMVFHTQSGRDLIIADLLAGRFETLIYGGLSEWTSPRWSPAGDKLVFFYNPPKGRSGLFLMNMNDSSLTMLEAWKSFEHAEAGHWSPTGSHLVYHHEDHFRQDSYLVRATAEGNDMQRLTSRSLGAGFDSPRALGWRQ